MMSVTGPVANFAQVCSTALVTSTIRSWQDFLSGVGRGSGGHGNRVFYLSVSQKYFGGDPAARGMGMLDEGSLKTRLKLKNPLVETWLSPDSQPSGAASLPKQVCRIDHYFGQKRRLKYPHLSLLPMRYLNRWHGIASWLTTCCRLLWQRR